MFMSYEACSDQYRKFHATRAKLRWQLLLLSSSSIQLELKRLYRTFEITTVYKNNIVSVKDGN